MEERAKAWRDSEGISADRRTLAIAMDMDMRYVGQNWELAVNLDAPPKSAGQMEEARENFIQLHQQMYGHSSDTDPVEVVSFRVDTSASAPPLKVQVIGRGSEDPADAFKGSRKDYFKQAGNLVDCSVYDKTHLKAGNRIIGPALLKQLDATTVIASEYSGRVDDYGNVWNTPAD